MRKPKLLKSGALSEQSMQLSVMDWVRLQPGLEKLVIHSPNEGRRTLRTGRLLKEIGMRAGVSDLFIAMPKKGYHGMWLELKSVGGRLSPAQRCFIQDMEEQNYYCSICYSIEDAIERIKHYIEV